MISVKRLRGEEILINAELIETVEETPDTIITLSNGHKLVVQDRMADVMAKIIDYKRQVYGRVVGPDQRVS
jgi:flagellar protein FlbD